MQNKEKTILQCKNYNLIFKTCYYKGVTLVALVVTIIVLLILAGVTITSLFNNKTSLPLAIFIP